MLLNFNYNETFHPDLIIFHFHASSEFLSTPPKCTKVTKEKSIPKLLLAK